MKRRVGFVSNSSSSSFVINAENLDEEDKQKIKSLYSALCLDLGNLICLTGRWEDGQEYDVFDEIGLSIKDLHSTDLPIHSPSDFSGHILTSGFADHINMEYSDWLKQKVGANTEEEMLRRWIEETSP